MSRRKIQISCRGILFDLDGVLLDSTPAVARVWHGWAVEHGFNPEEVVHAAHGRPSITTIREYLPGADYDKENQEVERREIADLDGVVPLPGAMELLRSLPSGRWGIVTSCTRPLAEVRLRAGGLARPAIVVTSDDIKHGKPAPDAYLKGARSLHLSPADVIVVEDAPAGVRAGKSAGCRVIAVRTTMPETDLRDTGADWIVEDCGAISLGKHEIRSDKITIILRDRKTQSAVKSK